MSNSVLIYSENENFFDSIQRIVGDLPYEFRTLHTLQDVKKLELGYKPVVAIIDIPNDKATLVSIFEVMYERYRNARLVFVFEKVLPFELEKIGGRKQNMTFLQHPFEDEMLISLLLENAPVEIPTKMLKVDYFNPISISDIRPTDKFGFDLYFYMPANNKMLLYRKKNSELSKDQIDNFQKFRIHDLFVRKNDMHQVRKYLGDRLKNTFGNKKISKTERRMQLQKQIRDIFGNFFDPATLTFAQSRIILETCKQVMGKFITEISPHPEIYEKILHYTAQNRGNFNHAVNVSVFAGLFAIALGHEDVESAVIGGLLHDIGISSLPADISDKTWDTMSEGEKSLYKTHPDAGLKILENKKTVAMDNVKRIVGEHHEFMDGSGYPKGLKKEQINVYARICQIADELDELTSVRPRHRSISPGDALDSMLAQNSYRSDKEKFDQEMLTLLREKLMPPATVSADDTKIRDIFSKPVNIKNPTPDTADLKRRRRPKKAI